jgi:hypothetical protein
MDDSVMDGKDQLRALEGDALRDDIHAAIASVNRVANLNARANELCAAIHRGRRTIFTDMLLTEFRAVLRDWHNSFSGMKH